MDGTILDMFRAKIIVLIETYRQCNGGGVKEKGQETEDEPETFINLGTKKSHLFVAN